MPRRPEPLPITLDAALRDADLERWAGSGAYAGAVGVALRLSLAGAQDKLGVRVDGDKLLLPGEGTLLECVTLHVALVPGMPTPSIAGDILLAEGVVEEGVIAVSDESVLKPGMRLKAVAEMEPGEGVYACRFVPMQEEVSP